MDTFGHIQIVMADSAGGTKLHAGFTKGKPEKF